MMAHNRRAGLARRRSGGLESEAVRVWLLDGFQVSVGPRNIGEDQWRLTKAKSLVKILALARDHRLHRESIMDLLWPGLDTRSATNNLYRVLHFARKALGPGLADTAHQRISLHAGIVEFCNDGSLWVDVNAFDDASSTARRSREPTAYQAALDLYAGDLLPE